MGPPPLRQSRRGDKCSGFRFPCSVLHSGLRLGSAPLTNHRSPTTAHQPPLTNHRSATGLRHPAPGTEKALQVRYNGRSGLAIPHNDGHIAAHEFGFNQITVTQNLIPKKSFLHYLLVTMGPNYFKSHTIFHIINKLTIQPLILTAQQNRKNGTI